MHKRFLGSRCSLVGFAILASVTACSKSDQDTHGANGGQAGNATGQGGNATAQGGNATAQGGNATAQGGSNGGCKPDTSTGTHVLIDDMETTDHGPIQFVTGINAPLSPGYWYNSGANYAPPIGGAGGAGPVIDTSSPPQGSFTFSALPKPTTTLNCTKASAHAAHQSCTLNGLYDTCGVGFEFAQQPDPSAGGAASGGTGAGGTEAGGAASGGAASGGAASGGAASGGAGGAASGGTSAGSAGVGGASAGGAASGGAASGGAASGGAASGGTSAGSAGVGGASAGSAGTGGMASVPMVTVPFDISRYKAVTFWGMTTTPDPTTNSLKVKISFPDTDTDPRGDVCNGGGSNTSKCYNSYAANFEFTTSWQQFTVLLDAGMDGVPPKGGIAIDPSWGYQGAKWIPTQVYGVNWQAQKNTEPSAGALMTDIWVDDVYFIE